MEIKKFILRDLAKKDELLLEEVTRQEEIAEEVEEVEEVEEIFADQNSLAEIGHEKFESSTLNRISLTQDELQALLDKAKEEGMQEAKSQEKTEEKPEQVATVNWDEEINLLKEKITFELHSFLDKIVDLALVIAHKLTDSIDYSHYADLIRQKILQLNNNNLLKIEVPSSEIAQKLTDLGIEISVNDAMLPSDYKIIWCNGFLEKKITEIAQSIDEIISQNKKF